MAAAVVLNAFQCVGRLKKPFPSSEEFFEGAEALIWLHSPLAISYFEEIRRDPSCVGNVIDVTGLATRILYYVDQSPRNFLRMYLKFERPPVDPGRYLEETVKVLRHLSRPQTSLPPPEQPHPRGTFESSGSVVYQQILPKERRVSV